MTVWLSTPPLAGVTPEKAQTSVNGINGRCSPKFPRLLSQEQLQSVRTKVMRGAKGTFFMQSIHMVLLDL